jgi:hypothetical protein
VALIPPVPPSLALCAAVLVWPRQCPRFIRPGGTAALWRLALYCGVRGAQLGGGELAAALRGHPPSVSPAAIKSETLGDITFELGLDGTINTRVECGT